MHLATGGMLYGDGGSLGLINLLLIGVRSMVFSEYRQLCLHFAAVFANTFIKTNYYHSTFTDRISSVSSRS